MKRLLLLILLIGFGFYIYLLYKNNNTSNEIYSSDRNSSERHKVNTQKQNELHQLKSILKQHTNDFINDDFIEQPVSIPVNVQTSEAPSNKHVHFSEQNEEFVFTNDKDTNQLNSDIFMESSFNTDKHINLTLSENEYFSKNV